MPTSQDSFALQSQDLGHTPVAHECTPDPWETCIVPRCPSPLFTAGITAGSASCPKLAARRSTWTLGSARGHWEVPSGYRMCAFPEPSSCPEMWGQGCRAVKAAGNGILHLSEVVSHLSNIYSFIFSKSQSLCSSVSFALQAKLVRLS